MKASDFRIGNLILNRKNEQMEVYDIISCEDGYRVRSFGIGVEFAYPIEDVKPIPLTPEWLERFGFKQWGSFKHLWKMKSYRLTVTLSSTPIGKFGKYGHGCDFELNDNFRVGVKYVHQVQNLYHALTGEELTLNGKG